MSYGKSLSWILATCVISQLGGAPFDSGGKSVKFPQAPEKITVQGKNWVVNGSFEEPGTKPNGWNLPKQKSWGGFFNISRGQTAAEKKRHKEIRQSTRREVVEVKGQPGKKELRIYTPDVPELHGKKKLNVSSKVFQYVKVPTVGSNGARFVVNFQVRGTPGQQVFVFVKSLKAHSPKNISLGPSKIRSFPINSTYQTISLPINLKPGCDLVDLTFALYGAGEIFIDEVTFTMMKEATPLQVYSLPAEKVDGCHRFGEKQPGILTFVFNHAGNFKRHNLQLAVQVPPEFKLLDSRTRAPLVQQKGNVYYFSLMGYTIQHLRDYYEYQAHTLLLKSDLPASEKCYDLHYWVQDDHWKSAVKTLKLKIIPTFTGRRPKHFKVAAMLGHEIEFKAPGTAAWAEFYRQSGFNVVSGARHNRQFAKLLKKWNFDRYDEYYNIANGYRLGNGPIPDEAQFKKVDGTAYPRKVCPVEVYKQGAYFRSNIVAMIDKVVGAEVTDHLMPNWEPYYLDSKGCFCPRCREEFVRYCAGKIPAQKIRAAWPHHILKDYLPIWQKFRSWQHGKLVGTLQMAVAQAGKKRGQTSFFIPEVTSASLHKQRYEATAQYHISDMMGKLSWVAPWGPYVWHDLSRYNESFPAMHLGMYLIAGQMKSYCNELADQRKQPHLKMIAMPHAWQSSFWVTTPEEIAMDTLNFFLQGWEGCFLYYFPRGYDYRYWKKMAEVCDEIAQYENFVYSGQDISRRVSCQPETALPQLYFPPVWEELPGGGSKIPGLSKALPIQYRAWSFQDKILVAIGNFWENGEHFCRLKISGLKGRYQVTVPGASCGVFDGAELERGILMQVGALRWQFITLQRPNSALKLPVVSQNDLRKLMQQRRPELAQALKREAKLYRERLGGQDLSGFAPVRGGNLQAQIKNNAIEISSSGQNYRFEFIKGCGISLPDEMARPAFWWTAKGAVESSTPFKLEQLKGTRQGLEIVVSRTLSPRDNVALSGLKLTLRYLITAPRSPQAPLPMTVRATVENTNADSVGFAFRFKNMLKAETFKFGSQEFGRNRQVSLFRLGRPDGELDRIYRYERQVKVPSGAIICGNYQLSSPQPLYGVVVWDGASMAKPTFELVFPKIILAPGATVEYQMQIK